MTCGKCGRELPEPGMDGYVVAGKGNGKGECLPVCRQCLRQFGTTKVPMKERLKAVGYQKCLIVL